MAKSKRRPKALDKPREELTANDKKALRAAARRDKEKTTAIQEHLYKPVEEWDDEELARGRPRSKNGTFSGPKPRWVDQKVHEEAIRRFKELVRGEMRATTSPALKFINELILNDDLVYDDEGQPIRHLVNQNTKLQAAQFLIEQLLGKPKQSVEGDIKLQVQSILAGSLVNPSDDPALEVGVDEDEDDEDDDS